MCRASSRRSSRKRWSATRINGTRMRPRLRRTSGATRPEVLRKRGRIRVPSIRVALHRFRDEAIALGVARHVFRPGDWVFDSVFTPDGEMLVAAVRDGFVRTFDLRTGMTHELGHAPSAPEVLVLSRDGRIAISGGTMGEVIA